MAKKVAEQDDSPAIKSQQSTVEETAVKPNVDSAKKKTPTSEPVSENSLKMPKVITTILILGFFVSIAASYGVQHYQDVYVIPPKMEKTFPFLIIQNEDTKRLRNIYQFGHSFDGSLLQFFEIDKPWESGMYLELLIDNETLSYENLKTFEYVTPDVYNGGKMLLTSDHHTFTITHLIYPDATLGLAVSYERLLSSRTEEKVELSVSKVRSMNKPGSTSHVTATRFHLLPNQQNYLTFPNTSDLSSKTDPEIETGIEQLDKNWQNKFDIWFTATGQQQIPKAYLELIKSAYSLVANSLTIISHIRVDGKYGSFLHHPEYFVIASQNFNYSTFDEQFWAIVTLSKLESEDTMRVLKSWMGTVNELGYMGNRLRNGNIVLTPIQAPLLFQVIKELLGNSLFDDKFQGIVENLEFIAEHTWKNSIGPGGFVDVKWLGDARGIFQLENATQKGSSSFELVCLLGDMCNVMQKVHEKVGRADNLKWRERFDEAKTAMTKYWNPNFKQYGDLKNGKWVSGSSKHVPLILSMLDEKSDDFARILQTLQEDPNFTPVGLQLSEEEGAPVAANYLLLKSLKHFSGLSGPSQELAHQMYSILKNNLAAAIARANRIEKSFYGRFDRNMRPIGAKNNLDGTLVLAIMSSS